MINISYQNDGNLREYGGAVYSDLDGIQYIKEAEPGAIWYKTMPVAEINVMNHKKDDPNTRRSVGKAIALFHCHFSGLEQHPSDIDIKNAGHSSRKYFKQNYLIATGIGTVYIYNHHGIITDMPVEQFRELRENGKIEK